ncbi:MAG: hypothetical protein IT449_05860 [Phycisphaerales bacterium]|nr:hypothetical protein [Phycisphaerales bacterium]
MRRSIAAWAAVAGFLGPASQSFVQAQCGAAIDLGRGRVNMHVPAGYDGSHPVPLVILLHGYTSSGAAQEAYMRFTPLSDEYGFVYAYPDGTRDFVGNRFWNATDACCNFFGSNENDSQYLLNLVNAIKGQCNIDPRRVYFIGHSNGGFMSYRMACDHSDVIAAIASLAGATFLDGGDCTPTSPVHVLQIHGTNDAVVFYGGGCFVNCYPGAVGSVEQWASFDGCSLTPDSDFPPRDLDGGIPGAESLVTKYLDNCDPRGSGELWTIVGGEHSPNLSATFSRQVIEWLLAHPKPGGCIGTERIAKARCRDVTGENVLTVKLAGGTPGDSFSISVSNGQFENGSLNDRGAAKSKFRSMASGGGSVDATWGCGASQTMTFTCP